MAERLLLRRDNDDKGLQELVVGPRRDRRARDQLDRARQRDRACASDATGRTSSATAQRANVPEDIVPDELTVEKAEELLAQPSGDRELGTDPETGREIVARTGRYGPYVTETLEEGSKEKPRTASLFKSMSLDTISLEEALQLLSLPRVVGESDGEEVTARNGRYGPYVQKGKESRSLETEEQLFTISLDDALAAARAAAPAPRAGASRRRR